MPKASVLWVNYNSMPIIDIALKSLSAVDELDYPNLELVIVDNGSTDGSFEAIRDFASKLRNVRVKIHRNERNLGFTGGNNVAYRLADKDSEYIVLLNNDAIPYPGSLREIVEYVESSPSVGAAQGVIYKLGKREIDNAGFYLDELLRSWPVRVLLKNPIVISYPSGCYAVIRRGALRAIGLIDRLFVDEAFAFFDDTYLGMKLWNGGYKVVALPFIAGEHRGSATFKRYSDIMFYTFLKAWALRLYLSNSKLRGLAEIYKLRLSLSPTVFKAVGWRAPALASLAMRNGRRLAKKLNDRFDIYKMPTIRLSMKDLITSLISNSLSQVVIQRYIEELTRKAGG